MLKFIRTNSENIEFQALVKRLNTHLKTKDGDDHDFYNQFNGIDSLKHVMVCHLNEKIIGCGAFKEFNSETVEIKRMYVSEDARGQQIGTKILLQLENWAKELGYAKSVLETGERMPDAIRLYMKNGYQSIPNYGPYVGVSNSKCFQKLLN